MSQEISIYIHIPFCKKKCDYCHFFVLPNKTEFKKILLHGLYLEWNILKKLLNGYKIRSLYFGGGTPFLFGPESIGTIIEWTKEILWSSSDIEITLEANPESMETRILQEFLHVGINRLSIGVQSLDNKLLGILSREHTAEKAIDAVKTANSIGFNNISIDLMYDIPSQSLIQWQSTLENAVKLPISHISLYNLTIEPQTVFYKYREKLKQAMPSEETSALMLEEAIKISKKSNFTQYEISAFSKMGSPSVHNTAYWTGIPFFGLGPSAFSYWKGSRYRNIAHLNLYVESLEKGKLPIDFEETLEKNARNRELLVIRLRLLEGVDLTQFQSRWGELESKSLNQINQLINDGLLKKQENCISLTKKGMLLYNYVASELI